MFDLAEIQAVYYMVAATGVLVAAGYYVFTMRVNQRSMKTTLETRQAQFMNQISDEINSVENRAIVFELATMEWKDWADFEEKYGSTGNIEAAARRTSLIGKLDNLGWLLKNGFLDPEWVHSQFHGTVTPIWLKFKPWVMQMRTVFKSPTMYVGLEYLGEKILEIERVKAPEAILPTDIKDFDLADKTNLGAPKETNTP
jgi:hypothetical protein